MQRDSKLPNFYLTKLSPAPTSGLGFAFKGRSASTISRLLSINRSIMDLIDPDTLLEKRQSGSDCQIVNFQKSLYEDKIQQKRIHHNFTYFAIKGHGKTASNKFIKSPSPEIQQQQFQTLPTKNESIILHRRKDLYDAHIDKYMSTKYETQQAIEQYLINREQFISEACQEIKQQIKHDPNQERKKVNRIKHRSSLPKIQQFCCHMLQKPSPRHVNGVYHQEITQLKKAQELDLKNRKRNQRVFRKRLGDLQSKMSKWHTFGKD